MIWLILCRACMGLCMGIIIGNAWESRLVHGVQDVNGIRTCARSARTCTFSRAHASRAYAYPLHTLHTLHRSSETRVSENRLLHRPLHTLHKPQQPALWKSNMASKNNSLREKMPTVAAWIDDLREHLGAETINASIKNGLNGGSDFWASENGIEIGNRAPEGNGVTSDKMLLFPKKYPLPNETGPRRGRKGRE